MDQAGFLIRGEFPLVLAAVPGGRAADCREGLEIIFNSLNWIEFNEEDLSEAEWMGTRMEGQLEFGSKEEGHVPIWSVSECTFQGSSGQLIDISIQADEQIFGDEAIEANLAVDILNAERESILASGETPFSGQLEMNEISLPDDGVYSLLVFAQPPLVFAQYDWFGKYEISLD